MPTIKCTYEYEGQTITRNEQRTDLEVELMFDPFKATLDLATSVVSASAYPGDPELDAAVADPSVFEGHPWDDKILAFDITFEPTAEDIEDPALALAFAETTGADPGLADPIDRLLFGDSSDVVAKTMNDLVVYKRLGVPSELSVLDQLKTYGPLCFKIYPSIISGIPDDSELRQLEDQPVTLDAMLWALGMNLSELVFDLSTVDTSAGRESTVSISHPWPTV